MSDTARELMSCKINELRQYVKANLGLDTRNKTKQQLVNYILQATQQVNSDNDVSSDEEEEVPYQPLRPPTPEPEMQPDCQFEEPEIREMHPVKKQRGCKKKLTQIRKLLKEKYPNLTLEQMYALESQLQNM